MSNHINLDSEQLYYRALPGGGFVAIEVTTVRRLPGQRRYRGDMIVERRISQERRAGHTAPAVASAEATTVSSVLDALFPVAQSNPEVAAHCIARFHERASV